MQPPSMEPLAFIQPGGLQGVENRNRSGFTLRACRSAGRMYLGRDRSRSASSQDRAHLRRSCTFRSSSHWRRCRCDQRSSQLRGVKEFMEQLFAPLFGHLVEHVAGCVGEGGAEAENLLEFLFRVERDNLARGAFGRRSAATQDRARAQNAVSHRSHERSFDRHRNWLRGKNAKLGSASATTPAANPAADVLRKSRLVFAVDIVPPSASNNLSRCLRKQESHACQITLITLKSSILQIVSEAPKTSTVSQEKTWKEEAPLPPAAGFGYPKATT